MYLNKGLCYLTDVSDSPFIQTPLWGLACGHANCVVGWESKLDLDETYMCLKFQLLINLDLQITTITLNGFRRF